MVLLYCLDHLPIRTFFPAPQVISVDRFHYLSMYLCVFLWAYILCVSCIQWDLSHPHLRFPVPSPFAVVYIGTILQWSYCTLYYCSIIYPVPPFYLQFYPELMVELCVVSLLSSSSSSTSRIDHLVVAPAAEERANMKKLTEMLRIMCKWFVCNVNAWNLLLFGLKRICGLRSFGRLSKSICTLLINSYTKLMTDKRVCWIKQWLEMRVHCGLGVRVKWERD